VLNSFFRDTMEVICGSTGALLWIWPDPLDYRTEHTRTRPSTTLPKEDFKFLPSILHKGGAVFPMRQSAPLILKSE
jgi:hypothetical protein